MHEKFKEKYRTESNRLPGWDYSNDGKYFLTFVVQNRICYLGKIIDGKMILSDWGRIVDAEFLKSFEIRGELFLDEYIIMPNHLHTIVILNKNGLADDHVERNGRSSLHDRENKTPFRRQPKSISSFVAGFKSAVNTKIDDDIDKMKSDIPKFNRNNHFFQADYYDRIIRDEEEYWRIKNYIRSNPENWLKDRLRN